MMNNPQDALLQQLDAMSSEARNPDSWDIDLLSSLEIVQRINAEDQTVAHSLQSCLSDVAAVADRIVTAFAAGGRLVYLGAGTSGRLGILDAVECPPTYSVPSSQVVALIAGGNGAVYKAVEGAEDNPDLAVDDLKRIDLCKNDILIGIAASGRTPYVLGGLAYARSLGCFTAAISCNANAPVLTAADAGICAVVGPEVVTGSTRMKAGTAQKLILNMLTTTAMIRSGKVYQNLMVDLHASNEKLVARAVRIVIQATDCEPQIARDALKAADMSAKLAILHILSGQSIEHCKTQLEQQHGFIRKVLEQDKPA
ncbi:MULTISPECIES: N-acetylmuramic acid 6-phosphate etherase [Rheinheimera]|jgi:N-acetylmuramic acid 6-phosphate etherase|uniref:N-acetylmuramic acid 6-phosphate etherase n=1 Tax=Rheinheimera aquimaris TaxID=412437 RepID=A0ABN1E941_9GAMM|nr:MULTISPECIES: N-acetylmuramic acid 6-phosphate etherase [Rheinheimera]MCB5215070.1 N-acetylmuramic acid 6-phosphate etherase [Rheinheimera aquimaris]MCD1599953.1 N-acetylmuramic acid 6-phosphate etherase [Rheinheimera aquimaris]HBN87980.1 N-acetylmuramic acid 6-phosphate etherase [Rheinheimera sp.]|tara:strand:- start:1059 stop:1994 length:936 start_codon:yes stop_codon:yes gene_type:complete